MFTIVIMACFPRFPAAQTVADYIKAVVAPDAMDARSIALVVTGPSGYDPHLQRRSAKLAGMHTLVIVVDAAEMVATYGNCTAAAAALGPLAQKLRDQNDAARRAPVLTGIGAGASLALMAANLYPNTFKGLVTEALSAANDPCRSIAAALAPEDGKSPLRWHDVAHASLAADVAGVRFYDPQSHGSDEAFYQAYLTLAGTDHAFDTATVAGGDLSDLPITVHQDPSAPPSGRYAIFLSGDGGWAKFDEEIAERLAQSGVPVVGISSMRYLWKEKSPLQIAEDITRIDRTYAGQFEAPTVILIGFSLGANVMPFFAPSLPTSLQKRITGLVLLSPERQTGFEIVMGGWMGIVTGQHDVAQAIMTATDSFHIFCLYGTEDKNSVCPAVDQHVTHQSYEGGHHLNADYDAVAAEILSDWAPTPLQ
ncbi:hypothetical protein BFP70_04955 [Thioclava sp. SK-1]|nr:hypothetical protein BFP70_04955 [Thioclava sp. SK-1]